MSNLWKVVSQIKKKFVIDVQSVESSKPDQKKFVIDVQSVESQ